MYRWTCKLAIVARTTTDESRTCHQVRAPACHVPYVKLVSSRPSVQFMVTQDRLSLSLLLPHVHKKKMRQFCMPSMSTRGLALLWLDFPASARSLYRACTGRSCQEPVPLCSCFETINCWCLPVHHLIRLKMKLHNMELPQCCPCTTVGSYHWRMLVIWGAVPPWLWLSSHWNSGRHSLICSQRGRA